MSDLISTLISTVLAAALTLVAAVLPGASGAPAAPEVTVHAVSAAPTGAEEPVTVIGLTDLRGDRTAVAVDGLEAVDEAAVVPAAALGHVAVVPATWAGTGGTQAVEAGAVAGIAVLTPPVATPEFMVAGVTWAAGDTLPAGARISLRVLEGAEWSAWSDLDVEDEGVAGSPGTEPFVTGGADAVQVQVTGDSAALPASLALTLVPARPGPVEETITETPTTAPPQPETDPTAGVAPARVASGGTSGPSALLAAYAVRAATVGTAAVGTATTATSIRPVAVARPAITSRAAWGADESLATWSPTYATLRAAVVHHTAGTNSYTAAQSPSIVRGIFYYHAVTRGWGDIGYNFLFDKYGQVFEGRRGSLTAAATSMTIGAHAAPFNTGTMGLSAMGDYTQVNAPQVILDRMADVIAWRFSAAGIDVTTASGLVSPGTPARAAGQSLPRVFGHRDVSSTACPGDDIYGRLASLRQAVASRVAGGGYSTPTPAPTPTVNAAASPFGQLDAVVPVPGGIDLRGWAVDPDTTEPIYVWVTVDGVGAHIAANVERADVGSAYPSAGSRHGFLGNRTADAGSHVVCVTASNVGDGAHTPLGCRTVVVVAGSPIGKLDHARPATGAIQVAGWTLDPDVTTQIYVLVTVDDVGRYLFADQARTDVAASYPGYGGAHGFDASLVVDPGVHHVCVTASNTGSGAHTPLGCADVRVLADPAPIGELTRLEAVPGGVAVDGWTLDPDTTAPVYVWLTLNGKGQYLYADSASDDVAAEYPGYGPGHGFGRTIPASAGSYRVCLTTSNVGAGAHLPLGCRDVVVRAGSPIGHADSVTAAPGAVEIAGWALDPDTTAPVYLWVTVDGQGRYVYAARTRSDIGRAFPGYGPTHGFAASLPMAAGSHRVCVTASNVGSGSHTSLGCWTRAVVPAP